MPHSRVPPVVAGSSSVFIHAFCRMPCAARCSRVNTLGGVITTRISMHVPPSQHVALFNYLDGRYADRVVLTFGQIEDLIGFSLPDLARLSADGGPIQIQTLRGHDSPIHGYWPTEPFSRICSR
jgi:hypothetical protein